MDEEDWFLSLDDIRDELFYEEGLIDLTASRILKTACKPVEVQSDPGTSLEPAAAPTAKRFGMSRYVPQDVMDALDL